MTTDPRRAPALALLRAAIALLALAAAPAHAAPPRAPPPRDVSPPSPGQPGPRPADAAPAAPERRWAMGFAAELGASPGLLGASPVVFGARIGAGVLTRPADGPARRWMAWLDAEGTDWFQPARPAGANRVDRALWIHPNLEVARQLARRPALSGWLRAGPTVGRYTVTRRGETLWFPGVAAGAGVLLDPVRVGVTWFGQWRSAEVAAPAGASPDVRLTPLVLLTIGLEYLQPFPSGATGR